MTMDFVFLTANTVSGPLPDVSVHFGPKVVRRNEVLGCTNTRVGK